ncbi:MAG: ATP-binding protein [Hyphomicrobiales bacterium]
MLSTGARESGNGQPPQGLPRRGVLLVAAIVISALAVLFLGMRVAERMEALQSAPQDNVQWSLAQLDVELLALDVAAKDAQLARGDEGLALKTLRQRFDIFYSRVNTIANLPLFRDNTLPEPTAHALAMIKTALERLAREIDGDDAALVAALPVVVADIESLRPQARFITLAGVKLYASESDATRSELSRLLEQTALVNTLLILAIGAALIFLARQIRISRRHAAELEQSSSRNASTVNASLDAIVVINMAGEIVEFNPAAVQTFGYSRNAAIGAQLDNLIIPERHRAAHRAGLVRLRETGQGKVVGTGRVVMEALRSDGSEFPVEMSLAQSHAPGGRVVTAFLRDISQRVEQEAELRRARDEALEGSRAKSQFLAMMSHEMRTPLNGVMALLDLLGAGKLTAKQKSYVETAAASAEILKQHVDDVLDLTRIQAGKLEFFPRVFNLVELLEEVQSLNLATAAQRGNRISLSVDMPEPYFVADRKRLHQVLTNLVGNAIKFTENGRISIAARFVNVKADVVTLQFEVSDTGIGIAPDMQAAIFEDFVTLDTFEQRNASGTGLGLPICRSIVEGMGGTIGVESKPGDGARFWFRVPLKAAFADQVKSAVITSKAALRKPRRALKVLVVEDNETNRFVARELLVSMGCHASLANNGAEGVAAAEAQRFDLILMDISMPVMNGWDAARAIRAGAGASQNVRIVALTAHVLPGESALLKESGMDGFLVKPLRRDALLALLDEGQGVTRGATVLEMGAPLRAGLISHGPLQEMKDLLGEAVFAERLAAFDKELQAGVRQLKSLCKAGDAAKLAALAHRLAGSASVFGAAGLVASLQELEVRGKAGRCDKALVAQFSGDAELTRAALKGL